MATITMVMPMAGRGSRFSRKGEDRPKPLIDLAGRPFFWWATESLRRSAPVGEMVYVVLEEHIRDHGIDRAIHQYYPDAKVVALPAVTSGAAETAMLGLAAVETAGPVAVNDCDHGFRSTGLPALIGQLKADATAGLLCFRSNSPNYSYACLNADDQVVGTVEKQVVSPYAVAGCYTFADPKVFLDAYDQYRISCRYDELFVSGLYNQLIEGGANVALTVADHHISFGTPEELAQIDQMVLKMAMTDGTTGAASWLAPRT